MDIERRSFCLLVITLAATVPALAHHSFAAYDDKKIRTLEGTVKNFQWSNPHVEIKVLVKTPGGVPEEWLIVTSGPAVLTRFGWTRTSLKPGDHISARCNTLSDGSHGGRLHTLVVLDTGQTLKTKLSAPGNPDLN